MILFFMSKERKDTITKKLIKLLVWLLVMTAGALITWKLYGKIDIKRTNFPNVTVKKQEPAIYDMYKVKSDKKNKNLYYVYIKDIYCDAYKFHETDSPRYFKIDIVFETHDKKDAKAVEEIAAQTVNEIRRIMKNYPVANIDRPSIMAYIKRDLKAKINNVLQNNAVIEVYFESFLCG